MIKGVIFDLWNTLIKQKHDYHSLKLIRELYGFSNFEYEHVKNDLMINELEDARQIVDFIGGKYQIGLTPEKVEKLDGMIREDVEDVELFEEVPGELTALKEKGMLLGLISNASGYQKKPFYDLGLDEYFDYACFSCDVSLYKPQPEIYKHTLDELGLEPEEAIMIGDSLGKDYFMSDRLGMKGIYLNRENKPIATKESVSGMLELV